MDRETEQKKYFTRELLAWHAGANDRELPWKNEKEPYKIWLSEVILQQTRAQQGLPYYMRFTEAYPTVQDMANADEEAAFRLWQGLGYYNRCKNMLATARCITEELHGNFPDSFEGLLALKGIGPYTASAIASFAFGLPHAVVDGNVYRVLARCFGIDIPFDTGAGKKVFAQLAQELLYTPDSAAYNQAIMDLGATVCTPGAPRCPACPLQKKCVAFRGGITGILPVRSKKQKVRKRYFNYVVLSCGDEIWIQKRGPGDIWQNLYELFLIETELPVTVNDLTHSAELAALNLSGYITENVKYAGKQVQRLTHQLVESHFFTIRLSEKPVIHTRSGRWADKNELKKAAFPKTLVSFLENNLYF